MRRKFFQFRINDKPAGPVRRQWMDAAQDAIRAGVASWWGCGAIMLEWDESGGSIEVFYG